LIAILADTHLPRGTRRIPDSCWRLLEQASLIVHAGDLTSVDVLEQLAAAAPLVAVCGNMDEPALRERLPHRAVTDVEGVRIGVVHDAGPARRRPERLESWFPGCDLVVYGHSHIPYLADHGGVWIVNPGSPTERRRAPSHTMAVVRDGRPMILDLDERV
jgi:putative phosphoesterase